MSMMSLQLLAPILGLPSRNGCTGRRLRVTVVSCKHNQSTDVQGASLTSRISRRDALSYVSSAFLATFLVTDRAEARTSRQENKRKVMEKLEKIREKALGPKEKNEGTGEEKGPVANLLIPPTLVDAYI
ncbi:uncharacterized protein LOC104582827 [Brachypodium distachyon]|uniref:Uncharacterized protein n=1 Tax=Brachypodium distachyon TaxID=15368 RepID=I1HPV5_BRADI|nr:uncharacterized protein LOC104582827 [Brachypodium distachyon]KQK08948.1 hypothetical protein BRADI_2g45030v3 [Brachypodium distachyon]|eukprot:XP_010232080.1 uncharacterized protein LOC104582827 [Brachypodium distachyon]